MIAGSAKYVQFYDTGLCPVCPERTAEKQAGFFVFVRDVPYLAPKFSALNPRWRQIEAMPWCGSGG